MAVLKSLKLGAEGVVSGTKYHYNKARGKRQYPTFLIYQYTDTCNSRCTMCNIWKKEPKDELRPEELEKIFKDPLFSRLRWVNLTGGEPFLRKDIVETVKLISTLPKLEGIAIPSNGFLTEKIVKDAKDILKILPKDQFLSITLSIDGFEKTHDEIRGVPGAYKKVTETLRRLKEIKNPNFNVGIQPTIMKKNLGEIEEFYNEMKKTTKSIGFAVMLESEGYYGNMGSEAKLNKQDKLKIADFLKKTLKDDPQYGFYYSKLIEMFKTGKRGFGCLAGYLTLYMNPYGDLYPCPVLSSVMRYNFGNVKDSKWFTKNIKRPLESEPICEKCHMMCDFINVAKVEFFEHATFMLFHPKILKNLIKKINAEKNPYF